MHFHDRGIGHGAFHIWLAADRIKAFLPDTGLGPVAKALEDGCICQILRASHARGCLCARFTAWPLQTSACPRFFALHRQACPGSARPSVPTACHSIPFFPWRDAARKGDFQQSLGHHAMNKGAQIVFASCLSWAVPCSFFACSKPAGSRGEAVRAETLMVCSARPGSARLAPSGSLRRGRRPASRGAGGR